MSAAAPPTLPAVFALGRLSRQRLQGVHPHMVRVVERAIRLTSVDFQAYEGLRTYTRQAALVRADASWTMNSRHITGHAVDLVPWVDLDGDGQSHLRWDWSLAYPIARAMRDASIDLRIPLIWGGVWDTVLGHLQDPLEDAVAAYVARRRAQGKPARIDGPHFELPARLYPADAP